MKNIYKQILRLILINLFFIANVSLNIGEAKEMEEKTNKTYLELLNEHKTIKDLIEENKIETDKWYWVDQSKVGFVTKTSKEYLPLERGQKALVLDIPFYITYTKINTANFWVAYRFKEIKTKGSKKELVLSSTVTLWHMAKEITGPVKELETMSFDGKDLGFYFF